MHSKERVCGVYADFFYFRLLIPIALGKCILHLSFKERRSDMPAWTELVLIFRDCMQYADVSVA